MALQQPSRTILLNWSDSARSRAGLKNPRAQKQSSLACRGPGVQQHIHCRLQQCRDKGDWPSSSLDISPAGHCSVTQDSTAMLVQNNDCEYRGRVRWKYRKLKDSHAKPSLKQLTFSEAEMQDISPPGPKLCLDCTSTSLTLSPLRFALQGSGPQWQTR